MDKANLEALLERVEKATGPDREADALLQIALVPDYGAHMELSPARFVRFEDVWRKNRADHLNHANNVADWWKCPAFTASIDAALTLVERVLPGWVWNVGGCQPDFLTDKDKPFGADILGPVEWVPDPAIGEEPVFDNHSASAVTAPLAILAALLKALIAQEATCAS